MAQLAPSRPTAADYDGQRQSYLWQFCQVLFEATLVIFVDEWLSFPERLSATYGQDQRRYDGSPTAFHSRNDRTVKLGSSF